MPTQIRPHAGRRRRDSPTEIAGALPAGRARRCCRCCTWCRASRATSRRRASRLRRACSGITAAEVAAVATFYTMYKRRPVGDYHVGVCTNTLCAVHGWRRDLRAAQGAPRRRQRRDHRRRQDHPRARRVQRGLRLRAGGDGQLGVLRQPDARSRPSSWSTTCARASEVSATRGPRRLHLARGRAGARRVPRRPRRRGSGRPARRRCVGLRAGPRARLDGAGPARRLREPGRARPVRARATEPGRRPAGGQTDDSGRRTDDADPGPHRQLGPRPLLDAGAYERAAATTRCARRSACSPDDLIQLVKDSGLRGRGGAGFPTGMKWGFIPQGDGKPHYLVVNADESEPGTCKDIPLMMATPAHAGRGRDHLVVRDPGQPRVHLRPRRGAARRPPAAAARSRRPTPPATSATNIHGSGYDLDVIVHAGAGAYICGEETALLDSLEGRRGQPRLRPPFPAVAGLYACPTVINNVESIASRAVHRRQRRRLVRRRWAPRSARASSSSRCPATSPRPGQYEAPLGITLRELLDLAGGMPRGPRAEVLDPGRLVDADAHRRAPRRAAGLRGRRRRPARCSAPRRCRSSTRPPAWSARSLRWTEFYKHESCGKCTPCREGTWWLVQMLQRLEHGQGHRGGPRHAARPLRQHPRPLVLRPRRRRDQPDHLARSSTSATSTSRTSSTAAARSTRRRPRSSPPRERSA